MQVLTFSVAIDWKEMVYSAYTKQPFLFYNSEPTAIQKVLLEEEHIMTTQKNP